jgi:hypothetical protein
MALHYQTEYRLGNGRRIYRSYTGFQASVAIFVDLVLGLAFEVLFAAIGLAGWVVALAARLLGQVVKLNWRILVAAMTFVVYLVTLPFAVLNEAVDRARDRIPSGQGDADARRASASKPDWAFGREV